MSYILDLYRRRYAPYESFLDFFLYISFFPQLVAGPLVRADFFLERLKRIGKPIELSMVTSGAMLFVAGVFKKAVLADNSAKIANFVFADPGEFSSLLTLLGLYAFAFQIYFDFSGYTDMARGIGRMLGIELPINFNLPYLSRGLREFWQRWHISLSTWLRDYLYISLGGNREGVRKTYRNLMITMLLGGLWHGASFNFIIWGGIHGGVLALEHAMIGKNERYAEGGLRNAVWIFLTFHLVCLAWIFFRADDFASAMTFLRTLTDLSGYATLSDLGYFKPQNWLFGLLLPFLVVFGLEKRMHTNEISLEMPRPFASALGFCVLLFMILLASGGSNEFVYFQF
jgi:D-alanyl-lipoteichoic acid acyltransferase DltB (MBOAT superfamily)